MLQYKIPQNIGIEDKIVGPFSLKQLIIVAVGGGTSYVLFAISSKLYELGILEYIIIALPGLLALAVALIKINNLTFTQYLLLALEFAIKPKRRLWDHRGISMLVDPDLNGTKSSKTVKKETKVKKNVNLGDLTRILDSGGFEGVQTIETEDIDDTKDDNLMVEAFFGKKKGKGENMWARTAKDPEAYKRKLNLLSKLPKPELQALKEVKEQISLLKRQQKEIAGLDAPKPIPGNRVRKTITTQPVAMQPSKTPIKCPKCSEVMKSVHVCKPAKIETEPIKKKKRRRPRKRKPKIAIPIKRETQINNTQNKKPVELLPKSEPKAQPKAQSPVKTDNKTNKKPPLKPEKQINQSSPENNEPVSGEIHLEELKKGDVDLTL